MSVKEELMARFNEANDALKNLSPDSEEYSKVLLNLKTINEMIARQDEVEAKIANDKKMQEIEQNKLESQQEEASATLAENKKRTMIGTVYKVLKIIGIYGVPIAEAGIEAKGGLFRKARPFKSFDEKEDW